MSQEDSAILWRKGKWRVEWWNPDNPSSTSLAVANGINQYNCVIYDDGTVAYDFPERIPNYVRDVIRRKAPKWAAERQA